MTLWIPFSPGFLNGSQSPSTLSRAIEPSPDILQLGCKSHHHAWNDFSSEEMLAMVGRQVGGRARPIHSETHNGRNFADSFPCSLNPSSSSNAVHNRTSSAHRSPNGGSLTCSMRSELENQAGDRFFKGEADDSFLEVRAAGGLSRRVFFDSEADDGWLRVRRLPEAIGGLDGVEFAVALAWRT